MRRTRIVVGLIGLAIPACYAGVDGTEPAGRPRGAGDASAVEGDAADAGPIDASAVDASDGIEALGLPCEVEALLAARCRSCHGSGSALPVRLVDHAALIAPAPSDPARSVAQVALFRMTSDSAPMPPTGSPRATPAEIAAFRAWVEAGAPKVACRPAGATDGGPSDTATPIDPPETTAPPVSVCSSGRRWSSGREGPTMNPGRACISCHRREEGRDIVRIGGTVYPTVREPDLCLGVDGEARPTEVVITDATGQVLRLPVGPTGNFSLRTSGARIEFPIRAKVVHEGRERAMGTPQTSGDCNGCHTETGANGAPGRIYLP